MVLRNEHIDIWDAKKLVLKVLKDCGTVNYSRLLMATELPQEVLEKTLKLLKNDGLVEVDEGVDPRFHLTSSRRFGAFWG